MWIRCLTLIGRQTRVPGLPPEQAPHSRRNCLPYSRDTGGDREKSARLLQTRGIEGSTQEVLFFGRNCAPTYGHRSCGKQLWSTSAALALGHNSRKPRRRYALAYETLIPSKIQQQRIAPIVVLAAHARQANQIHSRATGIHGCACTQKFPEKCEGTLPAEDIKSRRVN